MFNEKQKPVFSLTPSKSHPLSHVLTESDTVEVSSVGDEANEGELGYDMQTFVDFMPENVRNGLLALGNNDINRVVEVVMDLGRLPYARLGNDGHNGKGRRVSGFFFNARNEKSDRF